MNRRGFFAGITGALAALCPWNVAAHRERLRWHGQHWTFTESCNDGGYADGDVWFSQNPRFVPAWEWRVYRNFAYPPQSIHFRDPEYRTGHCKTALEAKQAAEAAIEELQK